MMQHNMIVPGELVKIGNTLYRLRYITYHAGQYRYSFSPGNEQLSPFVQNDVLTLSVNDTETLKLEVVPQ